MMELPTIAKSTYGASTATSAADLMLGNVAFGGDKGLQQHVHNWNELRTALQQPQKAASVKPKEKVMSRIVRVFIADPNENIPLEKRIIHSSAEFHTDLTDQELFFEANPAALLAKHNEYRVTVLNKKLSEAAGKEHKLEPARIRDLKMVVVDVATF